MSTGLIWIVVGILLIVSELLATSIVAVFIGVGALVTGILMQLGIIESSAAQYIVFGCVSLGSLLLVRKRCKTWFVGFTTDKTSKQQEFQQSIGDRVVVKTTFNQGHGRVVLNGVQWDARSTDELNAGDVAWVIKNDGITIVVGRNKP
ncbi:NfeD family protein [Aliidiomarina quisquiliarum]|uniref:NfeD family protein n=1 Tax=Aliidiomarina quisquiliarum TaxID=2938947 RepID=UPI00208E51A2|nr:NfeD family protein [Aliidiomarina quisquiliarum]MCO4320660.1 NfeD family protein [Aliidiomarina quisquiliarum]